MWLERLAIFGVPLAALLLTVSLLLGPGRERTVVGVHAYGMVTEQSRVLALRLRTMAHSGGRYRPVARPTVRLHLKHEGRSLAQWEGSTRPHGSAEARLTLNTPIPAGAKIEIDSDDGAVESFPIERRPTLKTSVTASEPIPKQGEVTAHIPRRQALASFAEPMVLLAHLPPSETSWPQIVLAGLSAEIGDAVRANPMPCNETRCLYRWTSHYTARAINPQVEVTLLPDKGPKTVQRLDLPVATGGWYLEPSEDASRRLKVRASGPRKRVWASVYGTNGRLWGGRAKAERERSGFSGAQLDLPAFPPGPLSIILSSDFHEDPRSVYDQVALGKRLDAPPKLKRLFDTLPKRAAEERKRSAHARWPVFGLVLSAGVFELFFVLYRTRRSRMQLQAHLESARADGDKERLVQPTPLLWLVIASACMLAAFASLASMSLFAAR